MSVMRRIAKRMGFVHNSELERVRAAVRAYAAAKLNRTTADWIMSPMSADAEIKLGMWAVRARARDLEINNDYVKGYLRACKRNIVGHRGFVLQMKIQDPDGTWDTYANDAIENAFADWSRRRYCTLSGKYTFRHVQELVLNTVKRDGEAFVRMVRGANLGPYGFALQLIEPDHVDETYNDLLPNGNIVRMGIEIDENRRPIAFFVKKFRPELEMYGGTAYSRGPYNKIPASDMIHVYDPDRFDQTRALSQLSQSMIRLHHLQGYEEAAVINARASACKMGFFTTAPEDPGADWTGEKDEEGNLIDEASPGTFFDLGSRKFTPYDPKYPAEQHDPFIKSNLRGISAGLGISYANVSQDLSETSYASGRTGLLEEREEWKKQQTWFTEAFLIPVFEGWLDMTLTMGAVNLPYSKMEKFNRPTWVGRRWAWVDPEKDTNASNKAIAACTKAPSAVMSEAGDDIEDVYQRIARDRKLAKKYGLDPDYGTKAAEAAKQPGDMKPADTKPAPPAAANKGNGKDVDFASILSSEV